jgi:hypothetical protein
MPSRQKLGTTVASTAASTACASGQAERLPRIGNATRTVEVYVRPNSSGQEQVQRMVPESISPRRP